MPSGRWVRASTQSEVVHKYFDLYYPAATKTGADLRKTGSDRYTWTTGSWLVLLQFGHNHLFTLNDQDRARGSIKSLGGKTEEIDNHVTHKHEVVHSFGWYMRKLVDDTKAKGAIPIVMSLTPTSTHVDPARFFAELASSPRSSEKPRPHPSLRCGKQKPPGGG